MVPHCPRGKYPRLRMDLHGLCTWSNSSAVMKNCVQSWEQPIQCCPAEHRIYQQNAVFKVCLNKSTVGYSTWFPKLLFLGLVIISMEDGVEWKILQKRMTWGYPHLRKPPNRPQIYCIHWFDHEVMNICMQFFGSFMAVVQCVLS